MNLPDLLKRSWHITSERSELHIYGTLSALFTILVGIPRLHYILRTDSIGWLRFYELLKDSLHSPTGAATIIISAAVILYAASFLMHVFSEGAIVSSILKSETSGQPVSGRTAFGLGMQSFLRLVEYKTVTSLFSIANVTIWLLLLDYYSAQFLGGTSIVRTFLPMAAFISLVILVLSVAFTYGEYHFIAERSSIPAALKKSVQLVVFYLSETVWLSLLLLLIFARTVVNVLLVFLLPAVLFGLMTFFAAKISIGMTLLIMVVVGAGSIWYAAKISGVLMVFTHAVWTLGYLELRDRTDHVVVHTKQSADDSQQTAEDSPPAAGTSLPSDLSHLPSGIRVLPGNGPRLDSISS